MKHLSRIELVDLIESSPTLSADRLRHFETCAECRAEAEALRDGRTAALEDGDAEPSPLFWNHFAARVAEAVRNEPAPVAATSWLRAPVITWATTASIVLLAIGITVWRTTLHAPSPTAPIARQAPTPDVELASPASLADDVDADEAWAVVRAAAVDLNWDDVHAAGISAHPSDVENVAQELSADERDELARLLDEDRKRNGV
jgi:hypothetical protein